MPLRKIPPSFDATKVADGFREELERRRYHEEGDFDERLCPTVRVNSELL